MSQLKQQEKYSFEPVFSDSESDDSVILITRNGTPLIPLKANTKLGFTNEELVNKAKKELIFSDGSTNEEIETNVEFKKQSEAPKNEITFIDKQMADVDSITNQDESGNTENIDNMECEPKLDDTVSEFVNENQIPSIIVEENESISKADIDYDMEKKVETSTPISSSLSSSDKLKIEKVPIVDEKNDFQLKSKESFIDSAFISPIIEESLNGFINLMSFGPDGEYSSSELNTMFNCTLMSLTNNFRKRINSFKPEPSTKRKC